jgi:hypothetical protein
MIIVDMHDQGFGLMLKTFFCFKKVLNSSHTNIYLLVSFFYNFY